MPPERAAARDELADRDRIVYGSPRAGVLTDFDEAGLTRLASHHDVAIEILCAVGDFVPRGAPLIRVFGTGGPDLANRLRRHIGIAAERTMIQDVAFGFRQLVDIAERALSPAMNDPTTAVQSLDRIHDLLRGLGARPFPSGVVHDDRGALRLVVPRESWQDLVTLSFAEIRAYGETSLQIARRLRAAFDDLIDFVAPERCEALEEMLGELRHGIERGFADPGDRERAEVPDAGGLGSDDDQAEDV